MRRHTADALSVKKKSKIWNISILGTIFSTLKWICKNFVLLILQKTDFSKCVIGWRPPKWLQGTIGRYKKNSTKILQKMYACCETFLECVCEYIWYVRKTEPVIIIILLGTYYLIRDCEAQNVFRHNFGKQHITQNNGQKKFQVFFVWFCL